VKIAAIWHPSYRFTNAKIYYQTVKAQFCR
jgi:hypothetical protein